VVSEHGCELTGEQSFKGSVRVFPRFDGMAGMSDRFINAARGISALFVARWIVEVRLRSRDQVHALPLAGRLQDTRPAAVCN
jgi:hypothetical protein